jgi:hypothetical protein
MACKRSASGVNYASELLSTYFHYISDNQERLFMNETAARQTADTPLSPLYEDDTLLGIGKVDAGKLIPSRDLGETQ